MCFEWLSGSKVTRESELMFFIVLLIFLELEVHTIALVWQIRGGILNGKESIKKAYEVLYVLQMQLFRFDS